MSAWQRGADRCASALLSTLAGQEWMANAACSPDQAEEWWALSGDGQEAAAAYCRAQCPVIDQCRDWADSNGETVGVWGGETEEQRLNRLTGRPDRVRRLHRCEHCQKVYPAKRPEQRYCGHPCHNLAMARAGGFHGADPSCGAAGGARRHRKRGEPVDALCRYAESVYRAQCQDRKKEVPA